MAQALDRLSLHTDSDDPDDDEEEDEDDDDYDDADSTDILETEVQPLSDNLAYSALHAWIFA